jgi:hypothetical protein
MLAFNRLESYCLGNPFILIQKVYDSDTIGLDSNPFPSKVTICDL